MKKSIALFILLFALVTRANVDVVLGTFAPQISAGGAMSWSSVATNIAPTNLTDFTLTINPTNSTWINLFLTNQIPQPVNCTLAFPTLVSTSAVPLVLNLLATDTYLASTNTCYTTNSDQTWLVSSNSDMPDCNDSWYPTNVGDVVYVNLTGDRCIRDVPGGGWRYYLQDYPPTLTFCASLDTATDASGPYFVGGGGNWYPGTTAPEFAFVLIPGGLVTNTTISVTTNSYSLTYPAGTYIPAETNRIMVWGQGAWGSTSTNSKVTP